MVIPRDSGALVRQNGWVRVQLCRSVRGQHTPTSMAYTAYSVPIMTPCHNTNSVTVSWLLCNLILSDKLLSKCAHTSTSHALVLSHNVFALTACSLSGKANR